MKKRMTLSLLTACLILSALASPALAWQDIQEKWQEEERQAQEENYRNQMRSLAEERWLQEQIRTMDRQRERYENSY